MLRTVTWLCKKKIFVFKAYTKVRVGNRNDVGNYFVQPLIKPMGHNVNRQ